jgi:hypothetical protein
MPRTISNRQTQSGHLAVWGLAVVGCILSPFLFIVLIDYVMKKAMNKVSYGIKWQDDNRLTDLDFADDIAMLAETDQECQEMTNSLNEHSTAVGLRISHEKTKVLRVNGSNAQIQPINIDGKTLENVEKFMYLGSELEEKGDVEIEVNSRLGKAAGVFRRLNNIWRSSTFNLKTKLKLYMSVVVPTAIYASEAWKSTTKIQQKLNVFHQRNLRRILGVTWRDHVTNNEVLSRTEQKPLHVIVAERRFRFAGHILRQSGKRPARVAMEWIPVGGHRKRGRPRRTWRSTFHDDLKARGLNWAEAEATAAERVRWRYLAAHCPLGTGGSKSKC